MASESRTRVVTVTNAEGLHLRPANALASLAKKYCSAIQVSYRGETVDGKSIMSLATLGAEQGVQLTILATGDDANDALNAIEALFAAGFRENSDEAHDTNHTQVGNDS
ncbi:MAG: HPr family phosphocarrier protein [Planctomycetes bacterium]|nr:HPr family phosphocarrier protein [Planctomycetota bacterium]